MLGKLMKYELQATSRVFLPLFAALIAIAVINRLLSGLSVSVPQAIGIMISVVLIIGLIVVSYLLTIQRFYKGLIQSEGYLMMTLPVRAESIILSKLFVASIWMILTAAVVICAVFIMAMVDVSMRDVDKFIRGAIGAMEISGSQVAVFIIEAAAAIILSVFSGILMLYTCMSRSMLVNKRRGMFSFGAYIAISAALQTVSSVAMALAYAAGFDEMLEKMSPFDIAQTFVLISIVSTLVTSALYFFITRHMLKNRLNLQ